MLGTRSRHAASSASCKASSLNRTEHAVAVAEQLVAVGSDERIKVGNGSALGLQSLRLWLPGCRIAKAAQHDLDQPAIGSPNCTRAIHNCFSSRAGLRWLRPETPGRGFRVDLSGREFAQLLRRVDERRL